MTSEEVLVALTWENTRRGMVEGIASVLLSGWSDIPEDLESQDLELNKLIGQLYKEDNVALLLRARELGITED